MTLIQYGNNYMFYQTYTTVNVHGLGDFFTFIFLCLHYTRMQFHLMNLKYSR